MFPFSVSRYAPAEAAPKGPDPDDVFARAPLLRDRGELIVASIVKSLQAMAGAATKIEGVMANFSCRQPRDVIGNEPADSVIGTILLEDGTMILVGLDGTLVHALVELLCGGKGIEPQPAEARPATPIDEQFAQIVFSLAATAMQGECGELGFASAQAARIDGVLTPDIFGARVHEVGILNVTISIFGLHGTLRFILPPPALDRFEGNGFSLRTESGSDPQWTEDLKRELYNAPVSVSAFLEAKELPLGSLAGLKVGQILQLPQDARFRAMLVSEGSVLGRGEVGREENKYSLRVDEFVSEPIKFTKMAGPINRYLEMSKGQ